MKHLLNDLSEEEKNNIREQHAGGMKVSNARFNTLLETKSGDVKPLISEQGTTPTLSATTGSTDYVSTRKVDDETVLKIRNLIIKEYVISDSEVRKSVGRCIGYLCRTEERGSTGVIYPQSLDKRLESYERCRKRNTNATQFLPPAKVVEVLKTIM